MRPQYNHLMIDIETLGINPHSPIISIGACAFCVKTGKIGRKFHKVVAWDIRRFQADVSTLQWWMKQSDAARLLVLHEDAPPIQHVLIDLNRFIENLDTTTSTIDHVWANGPSFDLVILRNAYSVCHIEEPWKFWCERDVRTARDHIGQKTQPTVAHNALEDAIAQTKDVIEYYRRVYDRK